MSQAKSHAPSKCLHLVHKNTPTKESHADGFRPFYGALADRWFCRCCRLIIKGWPTESKANLLCFSMLLLGFFRGSSSLHLQF